MFDCVAMLAAFAAGPAPRDYQDRARALDIPAAATATYFDVSDPAELECRLRRTFLLMDVDGDGYLTGAEVPVVTAMRWTGGVSSAPEEVSRRDWTRRRDIDDDGKISWPEMRAYLLPALSR